MPIRVTILFLISTYSTTSGPEIAKARRELDVIKDNSSANP
jgi:hypothetical protein